MVQIIEARLSPIDGHFWPMGDSQKYRQMSTLFLHFSGAEKPYQSLFISFFLKSLHCCVLRSMLQSMIYFESSLMQWILGLEGEGGGYLPTTPITHFSSMPCKMARQHCKQPPMCKILCSPLTLPHLNNTCTCCMMRFGS